MKLPLAFTSRPRLQRRRIMAALTIFGLLGYLAYVWLGDAVPREITVHTETSSDEAAAEARSFVARHGYPLSADPFHAYEQRNEIAYRYMESTVGSATTQALIESGQLPIMYWGASGTGAGGNSYFEVNVSFTGTVIGFTAYGPMTAQGPDLSPEASQRLAEDYLRGVGWDLGRWELITPVLTTTLYPSITQYGFVWQWPGTGWTQQLRLSADVAGHEVTSYAYYFQVPDTYAYTNQFYADLMADTVQDLSKLLFFVAAGLVYYRALRHGGLPWQRDAWVFLGALLLSLIMNVSARIEEMNGLFFFQPDWVGLSSAVLYYLNVAARDAVGVFVLWKGGVLLCRQVWPRQNKILPGLGNGWLAFQQAYWRGLMLAGLSLAYIAIFTLVARQFFNAGIPTRVQLEQQIAPDLVPAFLSPVYEWSSSLWAGISEELMFRFVGITLLLYFSRNKALALVIPAALWSYCHLFYVRDPFYLRGIELLLAGVLLEGLFFLYFDLTTVIVGHFAYNICVGQLLGLKSSSPFILGVTVLMLVGLITPLALAWIMARRTQRKQQARQPTGPPPRLTLARSSDAAVLATFPVLPIDVSWDNVLGQSDCVVAALQSGDELIGAAYGLRDQNGVGQLRFVYVRPEWRRRGWGTALSDKVGRHLQHRGARQITAFPMKDDSRVTQAFLFKLGFTARGQAYDFHPPQLFRWRRKSSAN